MYFFKLLYIVLFGWKNLTPNLFYKLDVLTPYSKMIELSKDLQINNMHSLNINKIIYSNKFNYSNKSHKLYTSTTHYKKLQYRQNANKYINKNIQKHKIINKPIAHQKKYR